MPYEARWVGRLPGNLVPISFDSTESQVQRLNPRPKTVSRQMPNRDSGYSERLFRLQFQVSSGRYPAQVAENTPQYM